MDYLNLEQIERSCPSVLTQRPSRHLSHIYARNINGIFFSNCSENC